MRLQATSSGIISTAAHPAVQERRSWLKRLGAALGLGMLAGPALAGTRGTQRTNGPDGDFIGQIILLAGNFAPQGYAFCNGQLLSIQQNAALFSLLGTTYGGNGTTTFGLPDLRGRFPIGMGQGGGLSNYVLGQVGGSENVTLSASQLPAHVHAVNGLAATTAAATSSSPASNVPAATNGRIAATEENVTVNAYAPSGTSPATTVGAGGTTGAAGSSQPFSNLSPYLGLNFCIALVGIYPSRS